MGRHLTGEDDILALNMIELLHDMVQNLASDLHIKVGSRPGFRKDGHIHQQEKYEVVTPEAARDLATQILTKDQRKRFDAEHDLDISYAVEDLARFRVNVLTQRGSIGMVIRQIPQKIPTIAELGLPQVCIELASKPRGLVLVTGPTGSGKSTTLAAMIDFINSKESGHILTMEDPLEFIHPDKKCFVTQRQIGQDTPTFSQGLRRALRQDPDVILIGEMRDLETISMAITAAETGHLVFGTLHTTSAISSVDRIIDVFPTEAQQQVRVQLSSTIQGVISQCLIPKIGGGRIAAREILIATDGIRALIREGKTSQMLNFLQTGKAYGMTTLENELCEMVGRGLITLEDAIGKANRPAEVQKNAHAPAGRAVGGMGSGVRPAVPQPRPGVSGAGSPGPARRM
jgi:twitching motility protein PilT